MAHTDTGLLDTLDARLAAKEREIEELRVAIRVVRRELSGTDTPPVGTTSASQMPATGVISQPPRSYGGRTSLPTFLRELLADGNPRSVDEIQQALAGDESFADRLPKRNTVITRLNELAKNGEIEKREGGTYRTAADPPGEANHFIFPEHGGSAMP
ncbi:MAG: hypothetical protein H0U32_00720 [Thermoleophilaceae bacterium]|nr:hypothetical protein [Thermoleophilaceae bacterium]